MPTLVTDEISTNLSWLTEDQIYFPERYVSNSQDKKSQIYRILTLLKMAWHSSTGVEYFVVTRLLKAHKKNNHHLRHAYSICLSLGPPATSRQRPNLNSLSTYSITCEWGKVYSGQTDKSFTPDSKNTNAISNRTNRRLRPRLSTQHWPRHWDQVPYH
jgi:hypothetical protein